LTQKVSVLEELRIIRVEHRDRITSKDIQKALSEVLRIREEQQLDRVLVTVSEGVILPGTVPTFAFAARLAETARLMRFAIACPPAYLEDLKFLENAGQNRGVNIRVFDNEEKAVEWLKEK
jgi:hypothetical protein